MLPAPTPAQPHPWHRTPNDLSQQWAHLPVTLPVCPMGLLEMSKLDLLGTAGTSCRAHLG